MIKLKQFLRKSFIAVLSILIMASCDLLEFKMSTDASLKDVSPPLASVGNLFLYEKDLEGLIPNGISKEDSADFVDRHIKSWIKKQLLISEAQKQLTFDEAELERRVLDYRYALMMHEFEKTMIQRNLDLNISDQEIQTYYQENIENFNLRQNIIRGYFIQLSKNSPQLGRFRYLLRSTREDHLEELKSYAFSYGTKVHLNDSVWVSFDDVISSTPIMEIQNKTDFLRRNTFYEVSDDSYIYFLRINQYKIQNDTSPIEFVRDDVQKIILNKRKVKLAKKLEDDIYENALKNDGFKIYSKS